MRIKKSRYQILCTRHISGITFISIIGTISNTNSSKLKDWKPKSHKKNIWSKESKHDIQDRLRLTMPEGGDLSNNDIT